MKKTARILWHGAMAVALAGMVEAMAWSPLQIGIFGGNVQICAPETEITGLRLNLIYGDNDDVTGLDLGIVSGSACINGLRLNAINLSDEHSGGVEIGLANVAKTEMVGWQCGILNYADSMSGFQLGLINHCCSLYGIQIGLINVIETGSITMLPIVNWAF